MPAPFVIFSSFLWRFENYFIYLHPKQHKNIMRKGLLIAFLFAITGSVLADGKKSLKDYCTQIDEAIEHSADYVATPIFFSSRSVTAP